MEPHAIGAAGRLGKRAAPVLARALAAAPIRNQVRLAGIYLDILQGRGSGTGWDMTGEVAAALRFLRGIPDPVVFDVGANHGEWTQGIWRALGRGRFFAYEPQAACLASLNALAMPTLTIVQKAVSDQPGEMQLHSDRAGSGLASLFKRAESYLEAPTDTELVAVTTIDSEFQEQNLDHIDFMKVDVEGAELLALQGAASCLSAHSIHTFAFEFGSANIYSKVFFRDCWDLVTGHGYGLWRIVPGGRLVPVSTYREDLEHFRGVSNYLASVLPVSAR